MNKQLTLTVKNLEVKIENKLILHKVDISLKAGEFHVVMGPNGSGKSTLTYALMGHPSYKVTGGVMKLGSVNLINLEPHERAKLGIMLAFQNPVAIPGVTVSNFLRTSYRELYGKESSDVLTFHKHLMEVARMLEVDQTFLRRGINDGFSGGEKKKLEMLTLIILKPKFAIFDEIDTGLDVDALKVVASGIDTLHQNGTGILLITHYRRILTYVNPQFVHVMIEGEIVRRGGTEIVEQIEEFGYANIHRI